MGYDFSGYATKHSLKCSDGRTISKGAFKDQNGQKVPLVWQHLHNDPGNILGHAMLEEREDGTYAYCAFNSTESAKTAKDLVKHEDIVSLSIYANQLVQKGGDVVHGVIREVSLVLSGANPGALIDNLSFQHGDSFEPVDDEAVIYTGSFIKHENTTQEAPVADAGEKTVKDVFDSMTEEQKNVVYFMLGQALGGDGEMSQSDGDDEALIHDNQEGDHIMTRNVFDNTDQGTKAPTLSHSQIKAIFDDAQKCGSLKESFLTHAVTYGIDDIDFLFPDAKLVTNPPDMISRRMDWVPKVIDAAVHSPFSRIKSTAADITEEEARARGYVKGTLKKEEVIKLLKRVTTPTTVYKKQKLDRDDIVDITDFNVVSWLKAEMRAMLNEELALAVLIGDGRDVADPDKINEDHIRPIYKDDDMYVVRVTVDDTAADPLKITPEDHIEAIIRSRAQYKGKGGTTLFTSATMVTNLLLSKDKMGRRLYKSEAELAADLRVNNIVEVELLDNVTRVDGTDTLKLVGIIVNMQDYTLGADQGGQVSMFDDFDIDYNQYKYLIETRCSGTLTHPKSAIVVEVKA